MRLATIHDGDFLAPSVEPGPGASAVTESAALLVAGSDPDQPARVRGLSYAIGQLDQTLRSSHSRWAIRRLTLAGDERMAPTRVGIKHALEAIARQTADVVIIVIAGTVTGVARQPALITGTAYRTYHEEATLPLAWIGQRLAGMTASQLVVLVSARPDTSAPPVESWLAALAPPATSHTIFVEASERAAAVEALSLGFRGGAIDSETGTVTLRSVADYLARVAPEACARAGRRPHTIIRPASLDDLRALGWSRPAVAGGAAASPADDLSCAVLRGEIRVDEVLARGSFGVVYRARQLWMHRDVALKVLPPGIDARSDDGQLFLDEIRAVARIDHPNVVRVFHADETYDGRLFYAMELLAGEDLDQIADRGPVPPARAVALVRQLLSGLAAAHEAGLIHADIKPGNAFVAHGGAGERVVLLDFGLARLARAGTTTASAGGTPQYMAPEQLTQRRVDERSDVFSAGLVLFTLLTGWRRQRASEIVPPLDRITDGPLRAVLARALALESAARYPRAADFAAALGELDAGRDGGAVVPALASATAYGAAAVSTSSEPEPLQLPPFRGLRSFSERDRDHFFGRDREVAVLLDHVLQLPAVIYTAPSGVGKTSLLRAGLLPRLAALGGRGAYVACPAGSGDPGAAILAALGGDDVTSVAEAWTSPAPRQAGRRVLIIDQIEAVLASDETAADAILSALLGRGPADNELDQAVVISVREDFLGRLVDRLPPHAPAPTIVRLPPLTPTGARDALVRPLAARRLAIDEDLLALLVADLTSAAASLGAEMGWGATPAVYPPHLQLTGARLHEALPEGASTLTLQEYQHVGGIDEIVRGHLTHVLESELAGDQVPIARELFKHLITPAQTRAAPTEAELIATVAGATTAAAATAVLEALRHHGLVIRVARGHREARWELIHDSLIPRIQAWMDDRDVERRRALEMLRHHARQSRPEAPSLLTARELRALRAAPDVVEVVEREWRERAALTTSAAPPLWTPARLVAHARAIHRRRRLVAVAALACIVTGLIGSTWWVSRRTQKLREAQIAANLGRFRLELAPFDWDAEHRTPRRVPIADFPQLQWELREPDPSGLDSPGEKMPADVTVHTSEISADGLTRIDTIEAPGRAAFLVIDHRGRGDAWCAPSIIPIRMLPGYALRDQDKVFHVAFPTCQASAAGTKDIPAGPYLSGGPGEPPSRYAMMYSGFAAIVKDLPRYAIDRTEVTNAAFEPFNTMSELTGIAASFYPTTTSLRDAGKPTYPVGARPWLEARAYCRYMGKDLPTSEQWEKALRGGLTLASGDRNPYPFRSLPWGAPRFGALAKLKDVLPDGPVLVGTFPVYISPDGPVPVGTFPDDISPEGVLDLAGNVTEWTRSIAGNRAERVVRGGNWENSDSAGLVELMLIQNPRLLNMISYSIGFRCVTDAALPSG